MGQSLNIEGNRSTPGAVMIRKISGGQGSVGICKLFIRVSNKFTSQVIAGTVQSKNAVIQPTVLESLAGNKDF